MKFPRLTIKIGDCIAVLRKRKNGSKNSEAIGSPLLGNKYGSVKYEEEYWLSHRLSYHLNKNKIDRCPKKGRRKILSKFVLHTCDNKWCVNPSHLYLGWQDDNVRDMYERNPNIHRNKSIGMIGNRFLLGKKFSNKTKMKMSKSQLRRWKDNPITSQEKENRSKAQLERHKRARRRQQFA